MASCARVLVERVLLEEDVERRFDCAASRHDCVGLERALDDAHGVVHGAVHLVEKVVVGSAGTMVWARVVLQPLT